MPTIRTQYIEVIENVRIRGYFSKSEGFRVQKSLETLHYRNAVKIR